MKMTQKGLFRVCFQPITTLNCCTTCISWEIGSYNTQQSPHNEHTQFCREIRNMIFRKWWGGGGQRPFGTFPKFHLFWCAHPSLSWILFPVLNLRPVVFANWLVGRDKRAVNQNHKFFWIFLPIMSKRNNWDLWLKVKFHACSLLNTYRLL